MRVVSLTEAVALNPKPDRGTLTDDTEISFVPMSAVEAASGRMDASTIRRYAEVKKGYTHFRDGDVLFAKITPCMENGKMPTGLFYAQGVKANVIFFDKKPAPEVIAQEIVDDLEAVLEQFKLILAEIDSDRSSDKPD